MDMQSWWDELVAQLSDPHPNSDVVIECLEHLLEGITRGEDLPTADHTY
jgi:hypothetical protein